MHDLLMGSSRVQAIDWNEISELGLLQRINQEIMHPLGLAIYRDTESGNSPGALVADDGVWEYSPEMTSRILSDDEVVVKVSEIIAQYRGQKETHENFNA